MTTEFTDNSLFLLLFMALKEIYKTYQHQSDRFDAQATSTYDLIIQVMKNYLVYAIMADSKILALKAYRSKHATEAQDVLQVVIDEDKILSGKWKSVSVLTEKGPFALVPKEMTGTFKPAELAGALLKADPEMDEIRHSAQVGNYQVLYPLPFPLKRKCDHHFPAAQYQPLARAVARMGEKIAADEKDMVMLFMLDKAFILAAFRDGNIQLLNQYSFDQPADIVYYVRLASETMKVEGEIPVFLAGEFESDSELFRRLSKHLGNLKIAEAAGQAAFHTQSNKIPGWKYAIFPHACA